MDLKEEKAIGGEPSEHWYYIAKGRAIKAFLKDAHFDRILDVGAGSGVFSRMLVDDGVARRSICVDPNYDDVHLGAHHKGRLEYVRSVSEVDVDAVLMIDVIEHVDDDVALVREYAQKAAAGTQFLISVPAFNFLWSSHDEFLEHRRRYSLDALQDTVEKAGLAVTDIRYFFGALFPAVAAMRLAEKALRGDKDATASALKAAPGWLNKSLVAFHDIERATLFPFNKVAGVTAFCLAEKPVAAARDAA